MFWKLRWKSFIASARTFLVNISNKRPSGLMFTTQNTKVKVRSPDGDTGYFDVVTGMLQGDTLGPYLFIICLDYVLRTSIDLMKEKLAKERSKSYPAQTITEADYADDIALLVNSPTQAESLIYSLERAAGGIGFHVNAEKNRTCALIKEPTSPH